LARDAPAPRPATIASNSNATISRDSHNESVVASAAASGAEEHDDDRRQEHHRRSQAGADPEVGPLALEDDLLQLELEPSELLRVIDDAPGRLDRVPPLQGCHRHAPTFPRTACVNLLA
jgi:hypothetical protein